MSEKSDVFLSHNSKDKSTIRCIAHALESSGFRVWFDEWDLAPGLPWQKELEKGLGTSKSIAVFIGANGIGRWETPEMRAALSESVDRGASVIPVLLPGGPNPDDLPIFLKAYTCVDMRDKVDESGLELLHCGILGVKPRTRPILLSKMYGYSAELASAFELRIEDAPLTSYRAPRCIVVADDQYKACGLLFAMSVVFVNLTVNTVTVSDWFLQIPQLGFILSELTQVSTFQTYPSGLLGIRGSSGEGRAGRIRVPPSDEVPGILLRFFEPTVIKGIPHHLHVNLTAKVVGGQEARCTGSLTVT